MMDRPHVQQEVLHCITPTMEDRYLSCRERPMKPTAVSCGGSVADAWPPAASSIAPLVRAADAELEHVGADLRRAEQRYDEAKAGGDWERARRAYLSAVTAHPRESAERAYARYMLAFVHEAMGRDDVVEPLLHAAQTVRRLQRSRLGFAVEHAFVALYARRGDGHVAREVIRGLFADPADVLERIADEMVAVGRPGHAVAVLNALRREDPQRACAYQVKVVKLQHNDVALVDEVNTLLTDFDALQPEHTHYAMCGAETARLLLTEADASRADGMANGSVERFDLAEQLYRRVLASFSDEQLRTWGICRPLSQVAYVRAELLFMQKKWGQCGPAFEEVAPLHASADLAKRAIYGAAICRQVAFDGMDDHVAAMPMRPRMVAQVQHSDDWQKLLGALYRYACVARDEEQTEQYSAIAYARANTFYEGGALWASAVGFRRVALRGPANDIGWQAMERYADVMYWLASGSACTSQLREDLDVLLHKHCGQAASDDQQRACAVAREVHTSMQ